MTSTIEAVGPARPLRLALAPALAAVLLGAPARAQDCAGASTQLELDDCAAASFATVDAELNDTYREIIARLRDDPATKQLLVEAQHAWLVFRDGECAFATSATAGGSIYPMLATQCRTMLTETRVEQLRAYLDCPEGDLACPVHTR